MPLDAALALVQTLLTNLGRNGENDLGVSLCDPGVGLCAFSAIVLAVVNAAVVVGCGLLFRLPRRWMVAVVLGLLRTLWWLQLLLAGFGLWFLLLPLFAWALPGTEPGTFPWNLPDAIPSCLTAVLGCVLLLLLAAQRRLIRAYRQYG